MIEGFLAQPMNEVLGGIIGRGIARRMPEHHGRPLQDSPAGMVTEVGQHRPHGVFHRSAVRWGVVQQYGEPTVTPLDVAQQRHDHRKDHIVGLAPGPKCRMGGTPHHVDGERTIQALPMPFITRYRRGAILGCPCITGVGEGLQGKLIQRH